MKLCTSCARRAYKPPRDRVNRLADALFGRDEFGTLRRYTPDQVLTLKTAFELLDHEELPRKLVVSLFTDPDPVFAAMSETMRRSRDSLAQTLADAEDAAHQFSDAAGTAERAARRPTGGRGVQHHPQG